MKKVDDSSSSGGGRQAVKTTIVGGQPPGNSRDLAEVPVGLEQLLAMAGASPDFERALIADRARATEASAVVLTPTERAVLGATSDAALQRMIAQVGTALPQDERRAFLQQAALALGMLVGGGLVAGCKDEKGSAPSETPSPPPPRPLERRRVQREVPAPPTGIRPDYPRPMEGMDGMAVDDRLKKAPPKDMAGARATPAPPKPMVQVRAGARSTRPMGGPKTNAGVSPGRLIPSSRPRTRKVRPSRGINPHRYDGGTGSRPSRDKD